MREEGGASFRVFALAARLSVDGICALASVARGAISSAGLAAAVSAALVAAAALASVDAARALAALRCPESGWSPVADRGCAAAEARVAVAPVLIDAACAVALASDAAVWPLFAARAWFGAVPALAVVELVSVDGAGGSTALAAGLTWALVAALASPVAVAVAVAFAAATCDSSELAFPFSTWVARAEVVGPDKGFPVAGAVMVAGAPSASVGARTLEAFRLAETTAAAFAELEAATLASADAAGAGAVVFGLAALAAAAGVGAFVFADRVSALTVAPIGAGAAPCAAAVRAFGIAAAATAAFVAVVSSGLQAPPALSGVEPDLAGSASAAARNVFIWKLRRPSDGSFSNCARSGVGPFAVEAAFAPPPPENWETAAAMAVDSGAAVFEVELAAPEAVSVCAVAEDFAPAAKAPNPAIAASSDCKAASVEDDGSAAVASGRSTDFSVPSAFSRLAEALGSIPPSRAEKSASSLVDVETGAAATEA